MSTSRQKKPFSTLKALHYIPKVTPKRYICNAYLHGGVNAGAPAKRCHIYKARAQRLHEIINNLKGHTNYNQSWKEAPSYSENPIAKAFLRRNAFAVRKQKPAYREKRHQLLSNLETKAKELRTKNYVDNVKFLHHLEAFHDHYTSDDVDREQHLISNSSSQRQLQIQGSSKQTPAEKRLTALVKCKSLPAPQSKPSQEVVLFRTQYDGPEVSYCPSSKPRRPLQPIQSATHFPSNTQNVDNPSVSVIGSLISHPEKDALLRSFYTRYHLDQFTGVYEDERDCESIDDFAYSALIEHSIKNPPPNGLKFREYSSVEYQKFYPSTKRILREWKNSLASPLVDYNENDESGYEDDDEDPLDAWNRHVREAKIKHRNAYQKQKSLSLQPHNQSHYRRSFESVQSEPPRITVRKTCTTTIVTSDKSSKLKSTNPSTEPKVVDVKDNKRSGKWAKESPISKKPRYSLGSKNPSQLSISDRKTPLSNRRKTIASLTSSLFTPSHGSININTPSTTDFFQRLSARNSSISLDTPVRRSPRALKAVCYKV